MLIHEPSKSVVFTAPDPALIKTKIPIAKFLDHAEYNIAVPHTLETVTILRSLGVEAPSPILTEYDWPGKYKPFAHQKVMADFLTVNKKAFNLSEMGVGKSAAALWAADWLMTHGHVRKALILSPLSTLERVWLNDVFDILMHRKGIVVHGSRDNRMKALKSDSDFLILNHDGVTIAPVNEYIRKCPEIDLVIVDEASMFRNHDTKKFKALIRMLRPDQRVWLLTGTPCPNAPTDAWALAKIISPERVPPFFGTFKRQTMYEAGRFKWMPKNDAYTIAYQAMQPAIRFKKSECLDLPPVTTQDWQCTLTSEQQKAYHSMRAHMIAEAKQKEITAVNAADRINKLRQILCGCVKDPNTDEYLTIPHKPRAEVLLDAIRGASAKVLVIVPFKGILSNLKREIEKHYSVAILNGDVTPRQRDMIVRSFKETPDPHVLLCHPKVMAHGLNLTEADTLIFYAPIYSNDEFQQVTERFNRAGQKNKMTIIRLGSHKLEWDIYKLVDNKRLTQDNILSLYRSITE